MKNAALAQQPGDTPARPAMNRRTLLAGWTLALLRAARAADGAGSEATASFRPLPLDALARMKLTAVSLVDASWFPRLPADLRPWLQGILDDPEG